MLKDLQSAGKSGEFYTPRPVTRFIVEQVNPKLGETVLDPACGTGGFLTSVIDRFTVNTTEEYKTLQRTIKGIEKKPFPYLLCVTNLICLLYTSGRFLLPGASRFGGGLAPHSVAEMGGFVTVKEKQ